jgi:hypothetical protein
MASNPRLRSIAFYDQTGRLVMTCKSRKVADAIAKEIYQPLYKEFFFIAEDQLKNLSYSQAVDFENKMKENNATQ